MRRFSLIAVVLLIAASCGGDDEATDTTAAATEATAAPTSSTAAPTSSTSQPETTSSQPETTTTTSSTTTIAPGPGALALTRIVFEPLVYVTITNVGNGPAQLGSHWLCQRPAYQQLPPLVLEAGDTVAIGLDGETPPALVEYAAVIEIDATLGEIDKGDGEMGLYLDPFFEDPDAISDYVEWGRSGHGRSSVAVEAGIWSEGAFVAIPEEASSISSSGTIGAGVDDWSADVGG